QSWEEYTVAIPATSDDYFGFSLAHNGTTTASSVLIDDVYLEDIPPLTVTVTKTDIDCYGDASGSALAVAEGGVPPYTYSWSPSAATTDALSNLDGGQYTVTVTDSWNRTATATITILEPTPIL